MSIQYLVLGFELTTFCLSVSCLQPLDQSSHSYHLLIIEIKYEFSVKKRRRRRRRILLRVRHHFGCCLTWPESGFLSSSLSLWQKDVSVERPLPGFEMPEPRNFMWNDRGLSLLISVTSLGQIYGNFEGLVNIWRKI